MFKLEHTCNKKATSNNPVMGNKITSDLKTRSGTLHALSRNFFFYPPVSGHVPLVPSRWSPKMSNIEPFSCHRSSLNEKDFLLRFSQTRDLESSKAASTIAFFAAVNHNYDHKQRTQNRSKSTNHRSQTMTFSNVLIAFEVRERNL